MVVKDFTGKEHRLNLDLYNKKRNNSSSLHKNARLLLNRLFATRIILEEVPLPGTRMFVDFFIPLENLMIEVQGQQHYEFNSFHYANKLEFLKAKKRDRSKKEWAELNGLTLVTLPYNEDENEWTKRIANRHDQGTPEEV